MPKIFDRGDIIRLPFNPALGSEQQGERRPALVLSPKSLNKKTGLVIAVPISQGANKARATGLACSLTGSGCETQGVIITHQIRSFDAIARGAEFVEKAPSFIVEDVLAKVQAIFD